MTSTKQTLPLGRTAGLLLLSAAALSCSSDGSAGSGGTGGDAGLRGEVLASVGANVVMPLIEEYAARATALEDALGEATSESGGRDAAQDAWREAMSSWQQLEMMQFGPLGSSLTVMGGKDLRARIYSWPILNLCQVDQQTVEEGYDDPDALEQVAGAPLGLWAIEYLLFNDDASNNCSSLNAINRDGIWDSMADMVPDRRLAYAGALSTLVRRRAAELASSWSPEGDNFLEELENPGRSGAVYGTAQEGLNAVSDALFYLDKETKDMKLGEPLGITGCETTTCPDDLESRWARWSKPHAVANLRAFQALFLGGSPGGDELGFDDLLTDMGAPDVASDMAQAIADAIATTEAVPGTFRDALDQDRETLEAAHAAMQAVTDILKSDFLSVLDLEAPDRAAGDND